MMIMPEEDASVHLLHHVAAGTGPSSKIWLHGFTGCGANGLALANLLGNHVVLPDLPGHGVSAASPDPMRCSMEEAAHAVEQLKSHMSPNQPVDLLGYSMGARLALYVAITRPGLVRRLILESGSPGLASPAERVARVRADDIVTARIDGADHERRCLCVNLAKPALAIGANDAVALTLRADEERGACLAETVRCAEVLRIPGGGDADIRRAGRKRRREEGGDDEEKSQSQSP